MRLDLFLSICRLIKRRSEAKRACDLGLITVNASPAKASTEVGVGDVIVVELAREVVRAEVLAVPGRRVSRAEADGLIRVAERKAKREGLFD